jgi:ABC-2 type transport system ATP-binding protein
MSNPGREVGVLLDASAQRAGRTGRELLIIAQTTMGLTRRRVDEVLDEPANGLDPAGIRWMRDLLRGYADRGATVLLSSHLLHEIEVVADDLVVIGHGHVVAAGTKDDLLAGAGTSVAPDTPRRSHRP